MGRLTTNLGKAAANAERLADALARAGGSGGGGGGGNGGALIAPSVSFNTTVVNAPSRSSGGGGGGGSSRTGSEFDAWLAQKGIRRSAINFLTLQRLMAEFARLMKHIEGGISIRTMGGG